MPIEMKYGPSPSAAGMAGYMGGVGRSREHAASRWAGVINQQERDLRILQTAEDERRRKQEEEARTHGDELRQLQDQLGVGNYALNAEEQKALDQIEAHRRAVEVDPRSNEEQKAEALRQVEADKIALLKGAHSRGPAVPDFDTEYERNVQFKTLPDGTQAVVQRKRDSSGQVTFDIQPLTGGAKDAEKAADQWKKDLANQKAMQEEIGAEIERATEGHLQQFKAGAVQRGVASYDTEGNVIPATDEKGNMTKEGQEYMANLAREESDFKAQYKVIARRLVNARAAGLETDTLGRPYINGPDELAAAKLKKGDTFWAPNEATGNYELYEAP